MNFYVDKAMGASRADKEAYFVKLKELITAYGASICV